MRDPIRHAVEKNQRPGPQEPEAEAEAPEEASKRQEEYAVGTLGTGSEPEGP